MKKRSQRKKINRQTDKHKKGAERMEKRPGEERDQKKEKNISRCCPWVQ